jgi:hypothetical protein
MKNSIFIVCSLLLASQFVFAETSLNGVKSSGVQLGGTTLGLGNVERGCVPGVVGCPSPKPDPIGPTRPCRRPPCQLEPVGPQPPRPGVPATIYEPAQTIKKLDTNKIQNPKNQLDIQPSDNNQGLEAGNVD